MLMGPETNQLKYMTNYTNKSYVNTHTYMPYCLQGKVSKGSLVQLRKELTLNVYTKDDKCILQTTSSFVKKAPVSFVGFEGQRPEHPQ